MKALGLISFAFLVLFAGAALASPSPAPRDVVFAGMQNATPVQQRCRRVPIWGFRISPFCKPSGVCNDRVIKGYRTVCN